MPMVVQVHAVKLLLLTLRQRAALQVTISVMAAQHSYVLQLLLLIYGALVLLHSVSLWPLVVLILLLLLIHMVVQVHAVKM